MASLFTIKDVAVRLSCSESLVEKWIHAGKLPVVKVGRLTAGMLTPGFPYTRRGDQRS